MSSDAIQVRDAAPPRYGAQTDTQDVPPGYKRTEVGVIPADWKISTFDRVCTRINGKPYQIYTDAYQVHGALPVVDQGQSHIVGYTDDEGRRFPCPAGGVIVFGDHTCVVKFVDHDFVVGADGTQIIATKPNHCAHFHAFALQLRGIPPTGYNRHFKFLKERLFVCPGPLEQRAIAEALSDVDELLGALEALIAKKRAIKQAAMQQLLTGKTRLPGFSGEWETKRLGEVADIEMGQSPSSAFYNTNGTGLPLIQGNADIANRRTIRRIFTTQITKRGRRGDILLSVRAPVGEVSRATFDVCLGRGVCAIRFPNDFLFHYLVYLEPSWARHSKGSTFDSVNSTDVRAVEVSLPDDNEQAAIATVLSDMDTEIAALEARRDKTRAIKQGMMQQLLTGRVRLVTPEAAA